MDYEKITTHVLQIKVRDRGIAGKDELFDTTELVVSVENINEYPPIFLNDTDIEVTLVEETEHNNFLKVPFFHFLKLMVTPSGNTNMINFKCLGILIHSEFANCVLDYSIVYTRSNFPWSLITTYISPTVACCPS